MQRLIIITGDLAAGKSTLAAALSESLGIPFIIKDTLKEIVCDNVGYQTRQENRLLSITATQDMIIAHRSMNLDYSLERFSDYINELRDQDFVFTPNYLDMSNLDEDEVTEEALQIISDELGE